jgi:hypothetical protein
MVVQLEAKTSSEIATKTMGYPGIRLEDLV